MYSWRSITGESNKHNKMDFKEHAIEHVLNWYKCADLGLENELVLCYNLVNTNDINKTSLKFDDRFIQKITASGKACSGKVTEWHSIAKMGTYNLDGTKI